MDMTDFAVNKDRCYRQYCTEMVRANRSSTPSQAVAPSYTQDPAQLVLLAGNIFHRTMELAHMELLLQTYVTEDIWGTGLQGGNSIPGFVDTIHYDRVYPLQRSRQELDEL